MSKMDRRTTNFALLAGGVGLYYLGTKTFRDHHEAVAVGQHDDFQHKYGPAIATTATLSGLGLALLGLYRVNKNWAMGLGGALGAVMVYNGYRHSRGETVIHLSPFSSSAFSFVPSPSSSPGATPGSPA